MTAPSPLMRSALRRARIAVAGLLAALMFVGCDATTPPDPPDPPDPPVATLVGSFAALTLAPDGAVRFTTTDVETGEVTHTPMVQFENLTRMREMWVSPDGKRALFRGSLGPDVEVVYVANTDGTEAHEIELFRNVYGSNYTLSFKWSLNSHNILYDELFYISVLPIGSGNIPYPEPIRIADRSFVVEGDTLQHIRGAAWGEDGDHVVVAASIDKNTGTPLAPIDLDVLLFRIPSMGGGSGVFERRLTTQPIRAYLLHLARGGHSAIASLDSSIPGTLALITEDGARSRRLVLPEGYTTEGQSSADITRVRWGANGRHVVLSQRLTSTPAGLTEPYAIGVIDTEDPDLAWHEFGKVNVGAKTLPVPLFKTP